MFLRCVRNDDFNALEWSKKLSAFGLLIILGFGCTHADTHTQLRITPDAADRSMEQIDLPESANAIVIGEGEKVCEYVNSVVNDPTAKQANQAWRTSILPEIGWTPISPTLPVGYDFVWIDADNDTIDELLLRGSVVPSGQALAVATLISVYEVPPDTKPIDVYESQIDYRGRGIGTHAALKLDDCSRHDRCQAAVESFAKHLVAEDDRFSDVNAAFVQSVVSMIRSPILIAPFEFDNQIFFHVRTIRDARFNFIDWHYVGRFPGHTPIWLDTVCLITREGDTHANHP